MIPQFLVMKNDLVLSFNETIWKLKFTETEQKVFEHGYPVETETRNYDVYDVYLNGLNYQNIKVKIHQDYLADDLRNVLIFKNDEYVGNTFFHSKTEVTLDGMLDIIKWVKFYTESK